MERRILRIIIVFLLVFTVVRVTVALAAGNTGAPGTFLRTQAGGYVDACKIVSMAPTQVVIGDGTLSYPGTRVTLTTRERIVLDYREGTPDAVVQEVVTACTPSP